MNQKGKAILCSLLVTGFAFIAISCRNPFVLNETNTVSTFTHPVSAEFYKDGNYDNNALRSYKHGNILITVGFTQNLDNNTYKLWGSFFSRLSGQIVRINSVRFSSGDDFVLENILDKTIVLDRDFKGFNENGIVLIENIGRDFFGEKQDDFPVQVTFEIGGESISQDFIIERLRIGIPIR